MSEPSRYPGIHLTGSLPLASAAETFSLIGGQLQPWARRVPDGETGERANWVLTQTPHFFDNAAFQAAEPEAGIDRPLVRIKPGVSPERIEFPPFAYGDYAAESYEAFKKAKSDGALDPASKFQISIPTPFNAVSFFVTLSDQAAVLPAYARASERAVREILKRFPNDELAIQWDLPTELVTIEGWFPNPLPDDEAVYATIREASSWVPEPVELGFHLCYGDSKFGASPFMGEEGQCPFQHNDHGRHILPPDIGTVVKVSNRLTEVVGRPINFIQAATMRTWTEPKHWEALKDLRLEPETQFYLGLVHASDGLEATRNRHAIASRYLSSFGISTECGLGRHSPDEFASVISTFRTLSASAA